MNQLTVYLVREPKAAEETISGMTKEEQEPGPGAEIYHQRRAG